MLLIISSLRRKQLLENEVRRKPGVAPEPRTWTVFANTRQHPATSVPLRRGMAKGEPSACLTCELRLARQQFPTLRRLGLIRTGHGTSANNRPPIIRGSHARRGSSACGSATMPTRETSAALIAEHLPAASTRLSTAEGSVIGGAIRAMPPPATAGTSGRAMTTKRADVKCTAVPVQGPARRFGPICALSIGSICETCISPWRRMKPWAI